MLRNPILCNKLKHVILSMLCAWYRLEYRTFMLIVSPSTLHVWQGRRVSRMLQVQSGSKIAGDGEAGRNILENIFEAVLCRIDSTVRFLCSWWLRQQRDMFLELIPPEEAQQIGWLDSTHFPSSWRHFHWYVEQKAVCDTEASVECLTRQK